MQLTQEQVLHLSGDELDEAVALAQGWNKVDFNHDENFAVWGYTDNDGDEREMWYWYHPSTNGSQCMEIMERERIGVNFNNNGAIAWMSNKGLIGGTIEGETAMIAICRCFVLSKLDVINK